MNIYIINCSNTYNYGSMMMGENFIYHFEKFSNESNTYYVETNDYENIERLKCATGINKIKQVKINSFLKEDHKKTDFLFAILNIKHILSQVADDIDLFISLGGDDFTEDYGWKYPILTIIKLFLLRKYGKDVVLVGQTIGPFSSFRKIIMKKLLSEMTRIYTRDPITFKYLKKLKLKNISEMDDLALLKLAKQESQDNKRKHITFCPSEIIYEYSKTKDKKEWIDFNIRIIGILLDKFKDCKLILLAHVLKPKNADDRIICKEIFDKLSEEKKKRVELKIDILLPYQARKYISSSKLTVSSRMHPIISSLQCEVPFITFSYSNKYWGIVGERYSFEDFILDIRYMNYDAMQRKFIDLLNRIDIDYEDIKSKMNMKNKVTMRTIKKAFSEIIDNQKNNAK